MARGYDPIEDAKVTARPKKPEPVVVAKPPPPPHPPPPTQDAPAKLSAPPSPPEPPKERYKVLERATIWGMSGGLTTLAAGSIVGPHTHDMAKLREQKVKLEPLA